MFSSFHGDKPLGDSFSEKQNNHVAIGRDDMEDKYLKLQDEHLLLKKHARNQEEKLKKLTTKVSRLISDKKRLEEDGGKKRDVEKDELLQDLDDKVRLLEKENVHLKEKLLVTKQQVVNNLKRRSPYQYVHPKVDTGIARPSSSQPRAPLQPGLPQYALGLLEEARDEITNLEELVASQRLQLEMYEQGIETLNEQIKVRENEHEEELRTLKTELTHGKKQHVQENIDLIKMNREVKHKSGHLTTLQVQYTDLEEKMKQSNRQFTQQIEILTNQLQEERSCNAILQTDLNSSVTLQSTVAQLQTQIQDLKQENLLIKESHDKLVNSALEVGSRNGTSSQELNHLENVLKIELKERKLLLEQLQIEKDKRNKLEGEVAELKAAQARTEVEKNELNTQIDFFRQESGTDFKELEEALALVGEKKTSNGNQPDSGDKEGFRENKLSHLSEQAQIEHSNMLSELEKTRNMLMLQYKINVECHDELNKMKAAHRIQMEERENLMQIRAARLEKLERQMEDVAFGTSPQESDKAMGYLSTNQRVTDAALDVLENPSSPSSDNELHVKILRCSNLLARNRDVQPSPYCVYKFYDLSNHSTVVIPNSNNPQFNDHKILPLNVTYQLNAYLQKQEMEVSVYDQKGSETFLGQVKIPLASLLRNVPIQGTYSLITPEGIKNGTIDVSLYWQRLYETEDFEIFEMEKLDKLPRPTSISGSRSEAAEESLHGSTDEELSSSCDSENLSEDEVIVSPKPSPTKDNSTIVISVNRLELDVTAPILKDADIQMLFVEYKFLDFPAEELETPFALPKPTPPRHVAYNFRKVFHLARKKPLLMKMLRSDSRVTFTVVSEPPMDHQDLDCRDVGVASVDLLDIVKERKDILEKQMPIYDTTNKKLKIGQLSISIQAWTFLKQILPDI